MRAFRDWDHSGSIDRRDGYLEYNRYRAFSDSFDETGHSTGKLNQVGNKRDEQDLPLWVYLIAIAVQIWAFWVIAN